MMVSFVEQMAGMVRGRDGRERPLDFNIKAEAASTRQFLLTGRTSLTGIIHAPPWAAEAVVEGTMEMSAMHRYVQYTLEFRSRTGEALVLEGRKNPVLQAVLRTMTHMPVVLRQKDGEVLAEGELRFDLRDLLPFASSWLPFGRTAQLALDVQRRAVARRALAPS
jgi:hypothetical protein